MKSFNAAATPTKSVGTVEEIARVNLDRLVSPEPNNKLLGHFQMPNGQRNLALSKLLSSVH